MKEKIHKPGGRVCRISQNLIFFFKEWKKWRQRTKEKKDFTKPLPGGGSAFYEFFLTKYSLFIHNMESPISEASVYWLMEPVKRLQDFCTSSPPAQLCQFPALPTCNWSTWSPKIPGHNSSSTEFSRLLHFDIFSHMREGGRGGGANKTQMKVLCTCGSK